MVLFVKICHYLPLAMMLARIKVCFYDGVCYAFMEEEKFHNLTYYATELELEVELRYHVESYMYLENDKSFI